MWIASGSIASIRAPTAAAGGERQPDLGIGRARHRAEQVGREDMDLVARRLEPARTDCRVRTTPFTCGAQASVTIRIRIRPRPAGRAQARFRTRSKRARRDFVGPVEDFHPAVLMLDQSGAAFHPVAVIIIDELAEAARLGGVDMAADDAVDLQPGRLVRDRFLEAGDELDRVLDLVLGVLGQRPVRQVRGGGARRSRRC